MTGHAYDRVYPDYVRVPASLEAHPRPEAIPAAVQRIAARIRAVPEAVAVEGDRLRLTLTTERPIDPRLLVYFERSDQFGVAKIVASEQEGRRLSLEVPVKRLRFVFG